VNRNSGNAKEIFLPLAHGEEHESAVEFGQPHVFQVFADGLPGMARRQFHREPPGTGDEEQEGCEARNPTAGQFEVKNGKTALCG
jgi:hypothetical protein